MRRILRARTALTALIAAGTLGFGATPAGAGTAAEAAATGPSTYALDSELSRRLGDDTAGSYIDRRTGALTVTVTSDRAAEQVRASGAVAKRVERSAARLEAAMAALESRAKITGTSWGIDPTTNQVSVEADRSVSARELARLRKVADAQDGAVRISRVPGTFKREVAGGDAIYGGGYRCSAAFNVSKGTTRYFVTAGHCTNDVANWSATSGGPVIGVREGTSFPTNDYGIVRYTNGSAPSGNVNLYNGGFQDIASAANAVVGQAIKKSGSTTKVTSGTVTAVNVTVNYGDGPVYGMVRTTACSAGGDSGGAHFAGSVALGIHSGSSGCTGTNGSAIHQPVKEALSAYGVNVY
ncbi:serine protease [Streptomyces agglomeratus]|uniref:Serine protease n=1 Tax=Streptomyces agglomeratus TaxID=285458 RepID=A0A1E5P5Q2_9ACTN|nr:S1 family peptidase [Streptomyces agglomeratus]OEJ24871.1 serine protease [Streptomyces agglomeratus]OEJ53660.1 serine protease [Streptomyces agglomeratus]OEJ60978.1 serine protease [Streptomyces agglomeratus]